MTTTKNGLQTQLNIIENYGKTNGLKFSPDKTQLIIFKSNQVRSVNELKLDLNQTELKLDNKKIKALNT